MTEILEAAHTGVAMGVGLLALVLTIGIPYVIGAILWGIFIDPPYEPPTAEERQRQWESELKMRQAWRDLAATLKQREPVERP